MERKEFLHPNVLGSTLRQQVRQKNTKRAKNSETVPRHDAQVNEAAGIKTRCKNHPTAGCLQVLRKAIAEFQP